MVDFETLLNQYTRKDDPKVHGVIAKCINKDGNEIYSKISGYSSLGSNAKPLTEDAVMKYASATKLITTIALLQCIDKGLISLDEPLDKIPTKNKITARQLFTHTSGLSYWLMHPLLMKWRTQTPEGLKFKDSQKVDERSVAPLTFEPGEGWSYGTSLDWAGVVVKRLHGGISLEDYMIENIWKPLGLSAPFPTFCFSRASEEYKARLMSAAERGPDGQLKPYIFWQGDNTVDQDGGHGLSGTAKDWLAVLADLISDNPKLLKPETVAVMFTPQIDKNSKAMPGLLALRHAWELITGPVPDSSINHGLGGVLVTEAAPELGQPKDLLGWGGAANTVWFASREKGVAGFFSTQLHPFADPAVKELMDSWKKDFWLSLG